jgi:hypothetical protein
MVRNTFHRGIGVDTLQKGNSGDDANDDLYEFHSIIPFIQEFINECSFINKVNFFIT